MTFGNCNLDVGGGVLGTLNNISMGKKRDILMNEKNFRSLSNLKFFYRENHF